MEYGLCLQARFQEGYGNGILRGIESVALNMIGMEISLEKIHEAPICRCNILEDLPTNLKNDIV